MVAKTLYERVLDDIASGNVGGSGRLKIHELAKRYHSSTNPIREVLRQLQGEGIVEFEANRGAAVTTVDADLLRDTQEILKLYSLYFIEWFAENATQEHIDKLEQIQEQIDVVPVSDKRAFVALDSDFHSVIHNLHYNRRAIGSWERQRKALLFFSYKLPVSRTRHQTILSEHREIIIACGNNDVDAAKRIYEKHIDGSSEQMYRQLRVRG